jgi:hypothetical protein
MTSNEWHPWGGGGGGEVVVGRSIDDGFGHKTTKNRMTPM